MRHWEGQEPVVESWRAERERRKQFAWRVWGVLLFLLACFWATVFKAWADPLPLKEKYVGEQHGKHIGDEWVHVEYWSKEQQEANTVRKGCLAKLLESEGQYIYVILQDGRMILGTFEWGRVHHSSLAAGEPVLAAGNIRISRGKIVLVDNMSGHYHPTAEHLQYAKDWLKARGALVK